MLPMVHHLSQLVMLEISSSVFYCQMLRRVIAFWDVLIAWVYLREAEWHCLLDTCDFDFAGNHVMLLSLWSSKATDRPQYNNNKRE